MPYTLEGDSAVATALRNAMYFDEDTLHRRSLEQEPIQNMEPEMDYPLDDEAISNEEQAYLRYDSVDRKFLLVPNLAKTNIISVNEKKPTSAVELSAMDLITVGRTQLAFVPFCGGDFDWSELNDLKG